MRFSKLKKDIFLIIISTAIMVILYLVGQPMYEENDDMGIIGIISGQRYQVASPYGFYMGTPLTTILYKLYRMNINFPWYSMMLYSIHLISLYLGFKLIFRTIERSAGRLCAVLGFAGLYSYMFYRLSFTSTSLSLWFVVCAYIALLNITQVQASPRDIVLGLLLGLSYLVRLTIFKVGFVFSLPLLGTFFFPQTKKRLLCVLLPFLFIFLLNMGFETLHPEYDSFWKWNGVRSSLMDTGLGNFSPNTATALKKTGWDMTDYLMAKLWWLHDDRIYNAEKLKLFLDNNKGYSASMISLKAGSDRLRSTKSYLFILLLATIAIFFNKSVACNYPETNRKKIRVLSLLYLFSVIIGILVLSTIRLPFRVAIPLYMLVFILTILVRPLFPNDLCTKSISKSVFLIPVCFVMVFFLNVSLNDLRSDAATKINTKDAFFNSVKMAREVNGKDTIFVRVKSMSVLQAASPFKEYGDMLLYKEVPGGWVIHSPFYKTVLKEYGLNYETEPVTSMIDNSKVVLAYWDSPDKPFKIYVKYFEYFLNNHYGSSFPGKSIRTEIVSDSRETDVNGVTYGNVFFKLVTEKKTIRD